MSFILTANNSENCTNPSSSKWDDANIDRVRASLTVLSAILCVIAIVLLLYNKLHRSFNYRLILCLLIASVINGVVDGLQIPFTWWGPDGSCLTTTLTYLCQALGFFEVYCSWNLLLTSSMISAQIFTTVAVHKQLTRLEIPCIMVSFGLPCLIAVVPIVTQSYGLVDYYCGIKQNSSDSDHVEEYVWFIPGLVVAGISMIILIGAILSLGFQLCRQKYIRSPETEELIAQREQKKYFKAIQETVPLFFYPMTLVVLLTIDSLTPINSDNKSSYVFNCISDVISGCLGGISSGIFFIHLVVRLRCLNRPPPSDRKDPTTTITTSTGIRSTYYTAVDDLQVNK